MKRWLALALAALPLMDLGTFFYVAERIGYGAAIAALVIAGVAGIALIRVQGFRALFELPQALVAGAGFGFHRWLRRQFGYIAAGVLLAMPGFLSDILAVLIIMVQVFVPAPTPPPPSSSPPPTPPSGRILEGEFRTEKPPRA